MKLSRERKVYVAVLALGGCVLGADRFMGGPSSAVASTAKAPVDSALPVDGSTTPTRVQRVALHEHLSLLASPLDPSMAGESFELDAAWFAELNPKESSTGKTAETSDSATPNFTPPKVTMVVQDASGGFAVLDGKVLRIGDRTRSGLLLVGIEKGVITVESEGQQYAIPVADPSSTTVR